MTFRSISNPQAARTVLNYPLSIPGFNGVTLRNRLVADPMEINSALANGAPSPRDFDILRKQFGGGWGINWLQATAVMPEGKGRVNQWQINEANLAAFEEVVKLHEQSNPHNLLLLQLTHSGQFALQHVSPYPVMDIPWPGYQAELLTDARMPGIIEKYIQSFLLAEKAGFHGAELKLCHGYLGNETLDPQNLNRPGWSFGGQTIEQRMRFVDEVFSGVRAGLQKPHDFVLAARFSIFNGLPGRFGALPGTAPAVEDPDHLEARFFVDRLVNVHGVRIINVSAGIPPLTPQIVRPTIKNPERVFDHFRWTKEVSEWVGHRAVVVGSAYSFLRDGRHKLPFDKAAPEFRDIVTAPEDPFQSSFLFWAGGNIDRGFTDMVGVGRQVLADPHFAQKILDGKEAEVEWCGVCGSCSLQLKSQVEVGCVSHDPVARASFQRDDSAGRIKR